MYSQGVGLTHAAKGVVNTATTLGAVGGQGHEFAPPAHGGFVFALHSAKPSGAQGRLNPSESGGAADPIFNVGGDCLLVAREKADHRKAFMDEGDHGHRLQNEQSAGDGADGLQRQQWMP